MTKGETITDDMVVDAFKQAEVCVGAENCLKIAQAMCLLYRKNNQEVTQNGEGLIIFASDPEQSCPNQGQLFCQDRLQ